MSPIFLRAALGTALATVLLATTPASAALLFNYPAFSGTCGTSLSCVGNTAEVGGRLRLAPASFFQSGAGYSKTPVTLGSNATFSTTFQFQFTNPGGIDPADGITFVLAANSTGLGAAGGGIGYQGVPNSVAVEFDTFNNNELGGSNHVGVDVNGSLASLSPTSPYGVSTCEFATSYLQRGCMSNGDIWTVTIGYDGALLTVIVKDGSNAAQTVINGLPINIASYLGTNTAFVGFTSATGSGYENHDILNWQLANDITILQPPGTSVPEPLSLGLVGIGLAGMVTARRRRR